MFLYLDYLDGFAIMFLVSIDNYITQPQTNGT